MASVLRRFARIGSHTPAGITRTFHKREAIREWCEAEGDRAARMSGYINDSNPTLAADLRRKAAELHNRARSIFGR